MELLKTGAIVPPFVLPDAQTGRRVEYTAFLRTRRIVVLVPDDAGRAWLAGAVRHARDFAERDLTVLAVTVSSEKPGTLPPGFHVLTDADGTVAAKLGGAPAFYLVGKDTGIKEVSRHFPALTALFGTIDAMPMRAQEKQERNG